MGDHRKDFLYVEKNPENWYRQIDACVKFGHLRTLYYQNKSGMKLSYLFSGVKVKIELYEQNL
jgi:hypothetical protein